jgi:3-deoxy-7-phosphoheptulonate synthase
MQIMRELRANEAELAHVAHARSAIHDVLRGADDRLFVVVGPCSIHDPEAALDYAHRLHALAEHLAPKLFLVMRVYFEKPRTTVGWKGLVNDPHMNGTHDMQLGLRLARSLLLDLNAMGLPAGTELLDPITPQYLADLIAWTAIGARTTESQTHREMASGLSMPVGFKNNTDGNQQVAINAMQSAAQPHTFLGINQDGVTSVIHTEGNPDRHIILRGGRKPNYDADSIRACEALLEKAGLPVRILVDCSHAQTGKDYTKQPEILRDLVQQIRAIARSCHAETARPAPGPSRRAGGAALRCVRDRRVHRLGDDRAVPHRDDGPTAVGRGAMETEPVLLPLPGELAPEAAAALRRRVLGLARGATVVLDGHALGALD